ncbi:MAG: serine/threonine-protein kinase [Myxococcota bacterium]|nr:serine/threonine-protein kinase [Myxococcota bacterium]
MTDSSASSDEDLTGRLHRFAQVWLAVVGLGVSIHTFTTLVLGRPAELLGPGFLVHAASVLPPIALWASCRRPRSVRFCRAVEGAALITHVAMASTMARVLADLNVEQLAADGEASAKAVMFVYSYFGVILVFASSITYAVRSALVPSRPVRTMVLGVALGIAMLATFAARLPWWAEARERADAELLISTGSLWALAVCVCAVLSSVIHGLRREIAKARKLGQYTLGEKIGEGGMGVVYHASHAMLRRPTAVKLLQDDRVKPEALKRFEREVQLTAQLTHPNTITIYDYGRTPDGVFYYAMELLGGATLQHIVETQGAQPEARVAHILRMVAGALAEAHARGLIHRDIKPANIMLGERGGASDVATVLDFGLVRELEGGSSPELTTVGAIVGTPMYLAPEVIKANQTSAVSDLYALGAVGYFMLTGNTVFDGDTVVEICGHHLHSPVTPPSQRLGTPIHPGLEALLLACLAKDPEARPESAAAFAEALEELDLPRWKPVVSS